MRRILTIPLLAAIAASAAGAEPRSPVSRLPFIDDDYPRALARARSKNLPIFIEAWAPW